MTFNEQLLAVAAGDLGLAEVPGRKDHPKIELAHRLTKIEGPKGGDYTDEIPWCSSMMVLWVLIAGAKLNPGRVQQWLVKKKFEDAVIRKVIDYSGWPSNVVYPDNGIWIPEPTWSAGAKSWLNWGEHVSSKDRKPGDVIVFSRTGGNHVTLFVKEGMFTFTCLGANQGNKVSQVNTYSKTRLRDVRRAKA